MPEELKSRNPLSRQRVLRWAVCALLLSIAMNAYHYSLEGARGLYIWHPLSILKILLYMGLAPITLGILSLPLEKLRTTMPRTLLRWASFISSIVVSIASIALLAFLIVVPRVGSLEPAQLNLIDPNKGIIAQEIPAQPAFQLNTPHHQDITGSSFQGIVTNTIENKAHVLTPMVQRDGEYAPLLEQPLLRLSFASDPHWGAEMANASARTSILQRIEAQKPDAFLCLAIQWRRAIVQSNGTSRFLTSKRSYQISQCAHFWAITMRSLVGNISIVRHSGQKAFRATLARPFIGVSMPAQPQLLRSIFPGARRCSVHAKKPGLKSTCSRKPSQATYRDFA